MMSYAPTSYCTVALEKKKKKKKKITIGSKNKQTKKQNGETKGGQDSSPSGKRLHLAKEKELQTFQKRYLLVD